MHIALLSIHIFHFLSSTLIFLNVNYYEREGVRAPGSTKKLRQWNERGYHFQKGDQVVRYHELLEAHIKSKMSMKLYYSICWFNTLLLKTYFEFRFETLQSGISYAMATTKKFLAKLFEHFPGFRPARSREGKQHCRRCKQYYSLGLLCRLLHMDYCRSFFLLSSFCP